MFYIILPTLSAQVFATICLLAGPIGMKKMLISSHENAVVQRVLKLITFIVVVIMGELVLELATLNREDAEKDHEAYHHNEQQRLNLQLNLLLLSGSFLFSHIVDQSVRLVKDNLKITTNAIALKKQAEGVSTEYLRAMKNSESDKEKSKETKEPEIEAQGKKEKVEQRETNSPKPEDKDTSVIAGLKKKISELEDENKSLRNKLEDFTIVFGDVQKKVI